MKRDNASQTNKQLCNQQRSKRRIEHRFRIVKQLPFQFAPQQIRG